MDAQETNGLLCYKKEAEARETGTRPVSPIEYAMDGCTG